MEVLGKFGINYILLAAQIVNFLIIFFIVKKFALGPIMKTLKNREKTIRDGLQQAEDARKLLETTTEKEKAVLRKAQQEAKELLEEAKQHRTELVAETERKTREQAEKILLEAKEQIAFETKEAEKRLSAHISELAIAMIQKTSSELFTEKEQEIVMGKALKNFKKKVN